MAGLGVEKLDKLMPDVVQTASKVDIASHVRDGYIMMFIYLPLTFGDKFTPYVGPIIPCILKVLVTKSYLLLRVKHFKITINNNIKTFLFLYSYFQFFTVYRVHVHVSLQPHALSRPPGAGR